MASCSTKPRRLRRLVLSERVRPSRVPRVPNRQRASVPDCASDAHPESPSPAFRDLRTFSLASHPLDCRSARSLGTLRHPSSYGSPSLAVGHFCHLPQSIEATNRALVSASRGLPLAQAERGHPMVLVSEAGSRFRREYLSRFGDSRFDPPRGPVIAANPSRRMSSKLGYSANHLWSPSRVAIAFAERQIVRAISVCIPFRLRRSRGDGDPSETGA